MDLEVKNKEIKIIEDLGKLQTGREGKFRLRHFIIYECRVCGGHFRATVEKATGICQKCAVRTQKKNHHLRHTRVFKIWDNMCTRCNNSKSPAFVYYGAKGIQVCASWRTFLNFYSWATTNGYDDGLTLDRIDVYKGYTPDNCRWVTPFVQARNTRLLRSTNKSGYRGVSYYTRLGKWVAEITVALKSRKLGYFDDPEKAAACRDLYIVENKLEHTLNFPNATVQELKTKIGVIDE